MISQGRFTRIAALLAGALAAVPSAGGRAGEAPGDPKTIAEYRIKAACLFRFAQFMEWPKKAFADDKSPLVVAVLGRDPFGDVLDQTLKGKTAGGRGIVIKRFASFKELGPCHVLFVGAEVDAKLERIFEISMPFPAATVGESEGFLKAGGMFRFAVVDNKVQFEINKDAAKQAGIEISSKLVRLSR